MCLDVAGSAESAVQLARTITFDSRREYEQWRSRMGRRVTVLTVQRSRRVVVRLGVPTPQDSFRVSYHMADGNA